jgi:predicted ATPase
MEPQASRTNDIDQCKLPAVPATVELSRDLSLAPRTDQYKILLTGSFGAGKTTLLSQLRLFDGITPVDECARKSIEKAESIQFHPLFQHIMLWQQVEAELLASQCRDTMIVSDRGVLDPIFFARAFGIALDERAILPFCHYQRIYLCSITGIDASHVHTADELARRAALEQIIRDTLREFGLEFVELKGSTEDRLATLRSTLPLTRGTARFLQS